MEKREISIKRPLWPSIKVLFSQKIFVSRYTKSNYHNKKGKKNKLSKKQCKLKIKIKKIS